MKPAKTLNIGITGSTGVLGRRLVHLGLKNGLKFRCLVRKSSNIRHLRSDNLELIYGDIQEFDSLEKFVNGLNVCIHLAALVGYGTVEQYHQANVAGTGNICRAILEFNPSCRLIYSSTIASLRRSKFSFINTDYTNSKYRAEKLVEKYQKEKGLITTYIYPGMIYGPQDTNFVPTVAKFLKTGKLFLISGGEANAPLIYIDDLCDLFLFAVNNANCSGKKYIGVGNSEIGIHDFFKQLARKLEYPEPSVKVPKSLILPVAVLAEYLYKLFRLKKFPPLSKRVVDVLSINLSPSLVNSYNGSEWKAQTNIETGINTAVQWCRENNLI